MATYTRQMRTSFGLRAWKLTFLLVSALYLQGADSPVLRVQGATGRGGAVKPPLTLTLEGGPAEAARWEAALIS